MRELYPLRIDIFAHITTPKYRQLLEKAAPKAFVYTAAPALWDLDLRFRLMDNFEGLVQVLTESLPSLDTISDVGKATDLAKCANDEMAELVSKYPERFVAAAACLPLHDVDASLKEIDRAINELRFRGIQINTPIKNMPLDSPEFLPLYEKMHEYDLPILIHPQRAPSYPDYKTEDESKYFVYSLFGWPYETTVAQARLVCGGILQKFPNLKIITHHCGAMVPYLEERIKCFYDLSEMRQFNIYGLNKAPIEYFKMIYHDTAIYGNTAGLMCAHSFCGSDHMLFGTDFPLGDNQNGYRIYRQTLNAIDQMDIPEEDKKKIYEENARRLLRLPV